MDSGICTNGQWNMLGRIKLLIDSKFKSHQTLHGPTYWWKKGNETRSLPHLNFVSQYLVRSFTIIIHLNYYQIQEGISYCWTKCILFRLNSKQEVYKLLKKYYIHQSENPSIDHTTRVFFLKKKWLERVNSSLFLAEAPSHLIKISIKLCHWKP
jgi:hypothetical protein